MSSMRGFASAPIKVGDVWELSPPSGGRTLLYTVIRITGPSGGRTLLYTAIRITDWGSAILNCDGIEDEWFTVQGCLIGRGWRLVSRASDEPDRDTLVPETVEATDPDWNLLSNYLRVLEHSDKDVWIARGPVRGGKHWLYRKTWLNNGRFEWLTHCALVEEGRDWCELERGEWVLVDGARTVVG